MKLICEVNEQDVEYITEAKENGQKDYKIKGVFMQGEIKNRNGRVYPMQVLDEQVKKYTDNYVNQNRAYGELGHPSGPTINLERDKNVRIYPNPAKKTLTIESFNELENNTKIELVDITGRVILSKVYDSINKISLDVNHFESGNYLIKITSRNNNITKKVTIE